MRAAVMRDRALVVADVPVPEPGPGEVLVRTLACGICRSDLHALKVDEHLQVSVKNRERLVGIRGEVSLHEADTRTGRHRATAVREDGDRLIVLPVVDDVAQTRSGPRHVGHQMWCVRSWTRFWPTSG